MDDAARSSLSIDRACQLLLAEETARRIREDWRPSAGCVLERAEPVGVGSPSAPGVLLEWTQSFEEAGGSPRHFALLVSVVDLIESQSYEEWSELPQRPEVSHWLGLLQLAVEEPHEGSDAVRVFFIGVP